MHKPRILIHYPDPAGLALLTSMLNSLGHPIEEAANDRAAAFSPRAQWLADVSDASSICKKASTGTAGPAMVCVNVSRQSSIGSRGVPASS